jgi:hypothetical protein
MNTTMIEHRQDGAERARPQWRIRHLACLALALMAISAGLGALAQRVSTTFGPTPAVTVVPDNGGFGRGVDLSRPPSQCPPTRSGMRVELVEFRFPTSPCTNPPVLVNDRASARSAL